MEDLQHILPDQIKNISNRKVYIILISLIGCFALLAVILGSLLAVKHVQSPQSGGSGDGSPMIAAVMAPPKPPPGVCVEPDCLRTAAWMTENMDMSVDPCDNFYQYACGGWLEKQTIPSGWSAYSVYSQINSANQEKVRELIQSNQPTNSLSSVEQKLKDFYSTCLHDYGRMAEGGKVVLEIIRHKFGGWYALDPDNWQDDQWDFPSAMTSVISDYLVPAMFQVKVYSNRRNRTQNIITLRSAYLGMYSNYYLSESKAHVQSKYKQFIRDMGRLLLRDANVTFNESKQEETLQTFVDDVYYQEKQVAVGITAKRRQPGYYRSVFMTVAQLTSNYTQINWLQMLRAYFGADINTNTVIYLREKPYFDMIDQILRNETENKKRIMNNFLVWSFLDTYGHHLSWEYRMTAQYFNEPFRGPRDMVPTWEQCIDTIEDRLGSVLAAEFINSHIGEAGKQQVKDMFKKMQSVANNMLDESEWMDNITRARAKEKISKLTAIVGFPDNYNAAFFEQLHSSLVIDKSLGYFKNLMNTNVFIKKLERMQLDSGRKFYLWRYSADKRTFSTRFLYFWSLHSVLVPAGAMQFPYMNPKRKSIIASGGMGSRLGTTVLFSVSDIGRYYWYNGSYWNWWTDQTYGKYILGRNCMKTYMTAIKAGPFLLDGQNVTINLKPYSATRLIREMATVKLAYQTYIQSQNESGKPPIGLNVTPEQGVFLSYAQSKCSKRNERSLYSYVRSGYYPPEIGVNSALGHMEEFSAAYKCSTEKKMNIKIKCKYF